MSTQKQSKPDNMIRIGDSVSVQWRTSAVKEAGFFGKVKEISTQYFATDMLIELPDGSERVFASDCHTIHKLPSL